MTDQTKTTDEPLRPRIEVPAEVVRGILKETTEQEARDIVEALYAMGPGLTMNDRYRFMAECLTKARGEGRQEMARLSNRLFARRAAYMASAAAKWAADSLDLELDGPVDKDAVKRFAQEMHSWVDRILNCVHD